MRTRKPPEPQAEDHPRRTVLLHEPQADIGPLVWWWDGHRWHGPEGSGDYGAAASQSRSRS